jgi:thymidylate synthase
MIQAFDIPDATDKALRAVWYDGEIFNVGYGSEETDTKKLGLTIEIEAPWNRPIVHDKAPTDLKHIQEYAVTYLYANYKAGHPYTYGSRLRDPIDQIGEICAKFARFINDRQCTATIRIPSDLKPVPGVKMEPPCLTMLDFEILPDPSRDCLALNQYSYFRSWDCYAGLPENIGGLQLLNESMANDITELTGRNVQPGKLVLTSKNCHIYQRQYKAVLEYLTATATLRIQDTWKPKGGE